MALNLADVNSEVGPLGFDDMAKVSSVKSGSNHIHHHKHRSPSKAQKSPVYM